MSGYPIAISLSRSAALIVQAALELQLKIAKEQLDLVKAQRPDDVKAAYAALEQTAAILLVLRYEMGESERKFSSMMIRCPDCESDWVKILLSSDPEIPYAPGEYRCVACGCEWAEVDPPDRYEAVY